MCKVNTGYHGKSKIEHDLCACMVDNLGIISPYRHTNHALSLTYPTHLYRVYCWNCITWQSNVSSYDSQYIILITDKVWWKPISAIKWALWRPILYRLNPIALRKAKIAYNFGLSECNRVKGIKLVWFFSLQISNVYTYVCMHACVCVYVCLLEVNENYISVDFLTLLVFTANSTKVKP